MRQVSMYITLSLSGITLDSFLTILFPRYLRMGERLSMLYPDWASLITDVLFMTVLALAGFAFMVVKSRPVQGVLGVALAFPLTTLLIAAPIEGLFLLTTKRHGFMPRLDIVGVLIWLGPWLPVLYTVAVGTIRFAERFLGLRIPYERTHTVCLAYALVTTPLFLVWAFQSEAAQLALLVELLLFALPVALGLTALENWICNLRCNLS